MARTNISKPEISIIIVNWNSLAYLKCCLELIYSADQGISFEVIVADNASYDGSESMVREKFQDVKFYQLSQNLGFAGANNFAASRAAGSVLLFLNPDTEPSPGMFRILNEMITVNSNAGAAGCLILNTDKTVQLSSLMPFPGLLTELLNIDFIIRKFNFLKVLGVKPLFSKKEIHSTAVSVISGACLAVKKDIFDEVGGFSKDYFMYSEDTDLCYKIKKSGRTNLFTNRCNLIHHGGGSSKQQSVSDFSIKTMLDSKFIYFNKNHGILYALLFVLEMLFISIVRLSIITVASPVLITRGMLRLKNVYRKWIVTAAWALRQPLKQMNRLPVQKYSTEP